MSIQLSKEEILKTNHAAKVINWEKVFAQNPSIIQSAYEAMDIYAKQQSIAFAEFILDNSYTKSDKGWYQYYQQRTDYPEGFSMTTPVYTFLTIEEIFELYLLSIKQG